MRDSKKAIISSVVFVLLVAVISFAIIEPYAAFSTDKKNREKYSGTIDYIFIGASHGSCAFDTKIIDEGLGCCSYNLCGPLMTFNGREALLYEEMERNPIKTVAVELSYNALTRESDSFSGNIRVSLRLEKFTDRIGYFFRNTDSSLYETAYSYCLEWGFDTIKDAAAVAAGTRGKNLKAALLNSLSDYGNDLKGYVPKDYLSPFLDEKGPDEIHDCEALDLEINAQSRESLRRIVDKCREKGIEVIFVTTPIPDIDIWRFTNWAEYEKIMDGISKEFDCPLYDFNLLKDRYNMFNDEHSAWGRFHLCDEGAKVFSAEYCRIMNMVRKGEDISYLFYDSYSSMKNDSPYNKEA